MEKTQLSLTSCLAHAAADDCDCVTVCFKLFELKSVRFYTCYCYIVTQNNDSEQGRNFTGSPFVWP